MFEIVVCRKFAVIQMFPNRLTFLDDSLLTDISQRIDTNAFSNL